MRGYLMVFAPLGVVCLRMPAPRMSVDGRAWGSDYEARLLGYKSGSKSFEAGMEHPVSNWALGPQGNAARKAAPAPSMMTTNALPSTSTDAAAATAATAAATAATATAAAYDSTVLGYQSGSKAYESGMEHPSTNWALGPPETTAKHSTSPFGALARAPAPAPAVSAVSEDAAKKAYFQARADTKFGTSAGNGVGNGVGKRTDSNFGAALMAASAGASSNGRAWGADYEAQILGYSTGGKAYESGMNRPSTNWALGPVERVATRGGAPLAKLTAAASPPVSTPVPVPPVAPSTTPTPPIVPSSPGAGRAWGEHTNTGAAYEARMLGYQGGGKAYETGLTHPATNWALGP